MTLQTISQIGIIIFGGAAVLLVVRTDRWARWGPVCGLCSTPFFLYATVTERQWAMTILAVVYAVSWTFGIYYSWLKPRKEVI